MRNDNPNILGTVELAGDPGVAGQVLTSDGPGNQAIWTTNNPQNLYLFTDKLAQAMQVTWNMPTDNSFTFTSPLSLSHIINHNLNNSYPSITVWDTGTSEVIVPASIVSNSVNQLTITFFVSVSIAGTIIG